MIWSCGKIHHDSWKDSSPESKRCGNQHFSFLYYYRWPKIGSSMISNGLSALKFFCIFWIVIRESIQPLFYRRKILREYMGCQACGRLLSHIWFSDLASEIFRLSHYNTGWSILKLLVEIHTGMCSKWSTRNSDRMTINEKKMRHL